MLEPARKLLVLMVGNNEKESFGYFSTRQRLVSSKLVMISNVSLSPAAMLGNDCQDLELRERRWTHVGAGVLWWCREKQREKEMKILSLQKGEKQDRVSV